MGVRRQRACYSDNYNVTITLDGQKWSLGCQYSFNSATKSMWTERVNKSNLYSLCRKLAKEAIKKNITQIDGFFNKFRVVKCDGIWYQMQSPDTLPENLLLPDFRLTDKYKEFYNK